MLFLFYSFPFTSSKSYLPLPCMIAALGPFPHKHSCAAHSMSLHVALVLLSAAPFFFGPSRGAQRVSLRLASVRTNRDDLRKPGDGRLKEGVVVSSRLAGTRDQSTCCRIAADDCMPHSRASKHSQIGRKTPAHIVPSKNVWQGWVCSLESLSDAIKHAIG